MVVESVVKYTIKKSVIEYGRLNWAVLDFCYSWNALWFSLIIHEIPYINWCDGAILSMYYFVVFLMNFIITCVTHRIMYRNHGTATRAGVCLGTAFIGFYICLWMPYWIIIEISDVRGWMWNDFLWEFFIMLGRYIRPECSEFYDY